MILKTVLNQFASDILRAFPQGRVIVPSEREFEFSHRKTFIVKVQTGSYDAVVLSNEQFSRIPLTKEREEEIIQDELEAITSARIVALANKGKTATVKQLVSLEKNAKERLKKLQTKKDESPITFESTGIDFLFVDEAHNFKNLSFQTNISDVKGINTTGSQRSSDLLGKVRYLQEMQGGGGVVFATGTPISNSMAEMYTMMKYLMPEELKQYGIGNFDEWASVFGEMETNLSFFKIP